MTIHAHVHYKPVHCNALRYIPLQLLLAALTARATQALEMPVELLRAAEMDVDLPPADILEANLEHVMLADEQNDNSNNKNNANGIGIGNGNGNGNGDDDTSSDNDKIEQRFLPAWLQQHNEQPPQSPAHHHNNMNLNLNLNNKHNNKAFIKLQKPIGHKQPTHKQSNLPAGVSDSATDTLHRCSMEVTNRVSGICQPLPPIGSACISGEYVDFLNTDCM